MHTTWPSPSVRSQAPNPHPFISNDKFHDETLQMEMDVDSEGLHVCYGMIPDLIAQFIRTRGNVMGRNIRAALEGDEEHIPLNLDETCCGLSTLSGQLIAVLNSKTSSTLAELDVLGPVQYLCFIQRERLQNAFEELQKSPDKVRISVDITILGPVPLDESVAKVLCRGGLYLQEPYTVPEPYEYRNPQYLDVRLDSLEMLATAAGSAETAEGVGLTKSLNETMTPMDLLLAMIDSLPQNAGLTQAEADARVTTELLAHQREALDFIIARETGNQSKFCNLWSLTSYDMDQKVYQHKITSSKSPHPGDIPGGILADEMGLCKTLSMISAIVATRKQAKINHASRKPKEAKTTIVTSTLVIVPSFLLLEGWIDEIHNHVKPGELTYYKYHGPNRRLDLSKPHALPDVILTTYGTVASECGRSNHGTILRQIHWYRIVLDEAHVIRNWSTKQFKAINNLSAEIRWCMTGTPVQNGVDDIGALVRFLRIPILGEGTKFRTHISGKIKLAGGLSASDYINLKLLLSSICLRRNITVLDLPAVKYTYRRPVFDPHEREVYNSLIRSCMLAIDRSVLGKPNNSVTWHKKNTNSITLSNSVLGSLLQLRLFCNQGISLGPEISSIPSAPDEVLSFLQQKGVSSCKDCGTDILAVQDAAKPGHGFHLTACHSLVCHECIPKLLADLKHVEVDGKTQICPFCQEVDNGGNLLLPRDVSGFQEATQNAMGSSKLGALIDDLMDTCGQGKSIVFSFWLKSLDLVQNLLEERKISFRRVDGSRSKSDKKQSLLDFQTKPDVSVLLMTFGTGSMGLNDLNVANRVHILEPQWNPSVESQGIGRVSRLGQKREVTVIRYVMQKSVEELVENRQVLKLMLAVGGGLGTTKEPFYNQAQKNASDLRQYLSQLLR
ncbi:SNF2 family N-terminal domain-containing protein [Podospora fimiseda]|uniref:SNF2 family N-terminal domain-containing protein n=1 Tax=Podospora fimiseda TaxID=252190 RepID=A0AAN6YKN5_9PEZI|nr:SNF2 family N-terminal domain-containing protein [Podospora fimiseda]